MRVYSDDKKKYSILCRAPMFFFDLELPSGRIYDKSLATLICKIVESEDVPIMSEVLGLQRQIGNCVGAQIMESGIIGDMVLDPKYARFEDSWNIYKTEFSCAIRMTPPIVPSTHYTDKNFVKFEHVQAFMI